MLPPTGARLLVASDGVWDAYEKMSRIGQMLRGWSLDTCPQRLIQARRELGGGAASRERRLHGLRAVGCVPAPS